MPAHLSTHLKLMVGTFFWALTPIFGRMLSGYSAPYALTFARFLVATTVLWFFLRLKRAPVAPAGRHGMTFFLLGLTGVCLHNVLGFMGMEHTEANRANVIFSTITIMIALIELVWFRQRLRAGVLVGILIGIFGTMLVVTDGAPLQLFSGMLGLGDGFILLSAACWALYSVLGRPLLGVCSPLTLTFQASLWGTLMLFPFLYLDREVLWQIATDGRAVLMLVFLGVINSAVGFLWYYEAIVRLGAVVTSAYINLVPIFGVLMSALLLGEIPTPPLLVGGGLVLVALFVINRFQLKR